jgi:signal transduction histidine kinase
VKSKRLAQWLQDHVSMLGSIDNQDDNPFHEALYESLIDVANSEDTRMLDSLLESAATRAVAVDRSLTSLLGVPQRLREQIWQRIGEEIDPEPAFIMLTALDAIFVHIVRVTIEAYQQGTRLAHAAQAAEISRLYAESEQKVMEYAAQVARANRELARLEQAKTDFISIAAHELKTPLTLIQGYVNILHDIDIPEQVVSLIGGINRGVERINNIIEDMLDLSALDMNRFSLVLEQVNLQATVNLIIAQLERALTERQQTIKTVNLESLPPIGADAQRVYQILKHLIVNAIKYTPDGGQIIVSGQALAAARTMPDSVQLTVEDTGVGIAPEDQEKVFDKFYRVGNSNLHSTGQTKFMGAGPGLGLAIAKGLVEAHGGRIWAESQGFDVKNCPGAVFTVVLPVQATPRPGIHVEWMLQPKKLAEDGQETKRQPAGTGS